MRKWLIFLLILNFLLVPTLVSAQNDIKIKKLSIQLWPEYDHPGMLVMYSLELTENTPLPAELCVRVPINAEVNAVAKLSEGAMLTVPYDTPVREGDWIIITLVIDELTSYRVEYYVPIEKNGSNRNFSFSWENDTPVESLFIEVQQPPSARNLKTTPVLPDSDIREDELIYYTLLAGTVKAGDSYTLEISYQKDNNNLTAPIEVGGTIENNTGNLSLNDSLPSILVGVGVFLIVGGLLYFFLAGRSGYIVKKHHKTTAGRNIYCHECGNRAQSGDRFCRACGAKLRV